MWLAVVSGYEGDSLLLQLLAVALFMAEFQAFLRIVLAFRLYFTPSLLASLLYFSLYNQPILVSNRDALSDPVLLAASRGKTPLVPRFVCAYGV